MPARTVDWQQAIKPLAAHLAPWVLLLLWYLVSRRVPEFILPSPLSVGRKTFELFFSPNLAHHTYASLARVLSSVAIALAVGGGVVLLARYLPLLEGVVVDRLIPFLNAFPSLGWAILAVFWFGVTNASVILVEVAILLPFCMINMWEGLKTLDPEMLEMARSFTRGRLRVLLRIILPMLFPYIFSSVRLMYGVAWKVSLIAELFGAKTGLGYLLNNARYEFETPLMFAAVVVIIILVFAVEKLLFDRLGRRFRRYQ